MLPFPFSSEAAAPADPVAPARPSGVTANAPRRFPAGDSGGAPTAGCKFRAITRPRDPKDAPEGPEEDPEESDGGGATTCEATPPIADGPPPEIVRCSPTASCGAGAITTLRPIFSSPIGRVDAVSTLGAGAIIVGCGPPNTAAFNERTSGGGATTEPCSVVRSRRFVRGSASGGGATTERSIWGVIRLISAARVSRAGGISSRGFSFLSDQATMLGSATSCFSFTLGGATMVCERLSASAGTEMIGCRENSGSAVLDLAERGVLRVSSGGRYSDAW